MHRTFCDYAGTLAGVALARGERAFLGVGMGFRWLLTAAGGSLLVGCVSTQQVASAVGAEWVGRNSDEIFVDYGIPRAKQQLNNGDVLYEWSADPYPVMGTFLRCDVRFQTDGSGIIKRVTISNDTIGAWKASRCSEVFSGIVEKKK
jgi:hypothetical protein